MAPPQLGSTVPKLLPIAGIWVAPFTAYYLLLSGRIVAERMKTDVYIGDSAPSVRLPFPFPPFPPSTQERPSSNTRHIHRTNTSQDKPAYKAPPSHPATLIRSQANFLDVAPRLHLRLHRGTQRRQSEDLELHHGDAFWAEDCACGVGVDAPGELWDEWCG